LRVFTPSEEDPMARAINIDERIAAKGEASREPVIVTFRGREWTFAPSMPVELGEMIAEGKIIAGILLALDKNQHDDFRALGMTTDELAVFIQGIAEIYGVTPGESQASE
jgi:hypothetical protein